MSKKEEIVIKYISKKLINIKLKFHVQQFNKK